MVENLINDLLDLAKLENNSFNINNEYFDLTKTIYEAFQIISYQATANNIELEAEIDDPKNMHILKHIYGDERRFLQILLNFLSNSLKFSMEGGKVKVRVNIMD